MYSATIIDSAAFAAATAEEPYVPDVIEGDSLPEILADILARDYAPGFDVMLTHNFEYEDVRNEGLVVDGVNLETREVRQGSTLLLRSHDIETLAAGVLAASEANQVDSSKMAADLVEARKTIERQVKDLATADQKITAANTARDKAVDEVKRLQAAAKTDGDQIAALQEEVRQLRAGAGG